MVYEHIFNVMGHAEAVVIMTENKEITKQEIEDAITSGNYALNVDYAVDGSMPENVAVVYSTRSIDGDDISEVKDVSVDAALMSEVIDTLKSAFAPTEYSED